MIHENTKIEETTTSAKPADLPEKFWDETTQSVRTDALLNSYVELERKLSTMVPSPDTEEGKTRIMQMMGVPSSPEEYEIDCSHGLFCVDPEVNRKMHEKGFTREQAQATYDLAAEKFVPALTEMAGEFDADREVERLISSFGGPEKWREVSRQLLAFGQKNLPEDVLSSMAGSFEGVMMLYRMMKSQAETSEFTQAPDTPPRGSKEEDLSSMMRDPRYWRDRDPQFVAKVTDGFKQMYGE